MSKYDLIIPEDRDMTIKFEFAGGHLDLFKIGRNRLLVGGAVAPIVALDVTHGKVSVAVTSIHDVPPHQAFHQAPEFNLEDWRGMWERTINRYAKRFAWDGRLTNIMRAIANYDDHFFIGLGYKLRPHPAEIMGHIVEGEAKIKGLGPTYLLLLEKNYQVLMYELLEGIDET